jgi:hypothetical protein
MATSIEVLRSTAEVSSASALLYDANVTGVGVPTHTPKREAQTYLNVATGIKHEWWANAWHI